MKKKPASSQRRLAVAAVHPGGLLADVRELIVQARESVAQTVNAGLTFLYWQIGRRIHQDILREKRADYGERIVSAMGTQLTKEFGRGFGVRNLFRMIRFAKVFPNGEIVSALRTQLGWTHFRQIITLDDPLKRDFYAEMCRIEKWNTRTLEKSGIHVASYWTKILPRKQLERKLQQAVRLARATLAQRTPPV